MERYPAWVFSGAQSVLSRSGALNPLEQQGMPQLPLYAVQPLAEQEPIGPVFVPRYFFGCVVSCALRFSGDFASTPVSYSRSWLQLMRLLAALRPYNPVPRTQAPLCACECHPLRRESVVLRVRRGAFFGRLASAFCCLYLSQVVLGAVHLRVLLLSRCAACKRVQIRLHNSKLAFGTKNFDLHFVFLMY